MRCEDRQALCKTRSAFLDARSLKLGFYRLGYSAKIKGVRGKLAPQQKSGILVCYKEVISFG
ncbi:hypothetical protein [Lyngbya sp. PCC 8106]|uniref:hypothetical protein n=1 Tax=Lyngbya sp. (strain PCC 8106) TaxID=313612 RepID=UPI00031E16F7|nr:hypothetical protein [Lyngbya sp. PCC 8106]